MRVIQILITVGLAALLCACGGGDDTAAKAVTGSAVITATAPVFNGPVHSGDSVTFGGGACVGGNGELTAMWSYGDGSPNDIKRTHTYSATATTFYLVTVTCTDTANNPAVTTEALRIQVDP